MGCLAHNYFENHFYHMSSQDKVTETRKLPRRITPFFCSCGFLVVIVVCNCVCQWLLVVGLHRKLLVVGNLLVDAGVFIVVVVVLTADVKLCDDFITFFCCIASGCFLGRWFVFVLIYVLICSSLLLLLLLCCCVVTMVRCLK